MASVEQFEEIDVREKAVRPGWTYCRSSDQLFSCGTQVEIQPTIKYSLTLMNAEEMKNFQQNGWYYDQPWAQDFATLDSNVTCLVQGTTVLENKGSNISPDSLRYTVSSVSQKYYADMLMVFSEYMDDADRNEMVTNLSQVLYGGCEASILERKSKLFKVAFIYDKVTSSRFEETSINNCVEKFCSILKNSKFPDVPLTLRLMKPSPVAPRRPFTEGRGVSETQTFDLQNSKYEKRNCEQNMQTPLVPQSVHKNTHQASNHHTEDVQELISLSVAKDYSYSDDGCDSYLLNQADPCGILREQVGGSEYNTHNVTRRSTEDPNRMILEISNLDTPSERCKEESLETQRCIYTNKSFSGVENIDEVLHTVDDNSQKVSTPHTKRQDHTCKAKENSTTLSNKINLDENSQTQKQVVQRAPTNCHEIHQFAGELSDRASESRVLHPMKSSIGPCNMTRKYFGVTGSKMKEKVIILLGAADSGKTTLVNFIANCIKGTNIADDVLVYVDTDSSEAHSRTTSITAYTFCFKEDDIPITIIDTPGLNDSSGANKDDRVQSLKTFIGDVSKSLDIHALGFVARAHQLLLTPAERLVIDYVSTLFGQGVADHLIPLITFADNQEIPPVVEAMKNYGVRSKSVLKFNNCMINGNPKQQIDEMDRICWKIGSKSWRKCMKCLQELPPLAVNTFKAHQSKAYASTVMESAAKNLKAELKKFVESCRDSKCMSKETFKSCEQVWELAAVLHHLKRTRESSVPNVQNILVTYAQEVCEDDAFPAGDCVRLLSLAPSKGLLGAGIGVIRSLGPLYEQAKRSPTPKDIVTKNNPRILFCQKCGEDHEIERSPPVNDSWMSKVRVNKDITYTCTKCKCDDSSHISSYRKTAIQVDFPSEYLLQDARQRIENILREHSPRDYKISKDQYLYHVNIALDYKFQVLVSDM